MFHGMTEDELMTFWSRYHRPTRKDAAALVGDTRKGYLGVAETLANIACNVAVTMGCMRRDDANGVACYSHHVILGMGRLPDDVRSRVTIPDYRQ